MTYSIEDEHSDEIPDHPARISDSNDRLHEEICLARQELAHAHQQLMLEQDQSRRKLALELHDEGIQQLLGILFQLREMERDLNRLTSQDVHNKLVGHMASTLHSVQDETQSLVNYLRALMYDLHPPGLEEMGLTLALESYVNHLKDRNSLTKPLLKLDMDRIGPTDLPMPLATSLFRTAQEALHNALQHARARHISLLLCCSVDWVMLIIKDDGCGFRVPARVSELVRSGHFGLVGMSERVAWAGGRLDILSQPGAGTGVTVRIPLESVNA